MITQGMRPITAEATSQQTLEIGGLPLTTLNDEQSPPRLKHVRQYGPDPNCQQSDETHGLGTGM